MVAATDGVEKDDVLALRQYASAREDEQDDSGAAVLRAMAAQRGVQSGEAEAGAPPPPPPPPPVPKKRFVDTLVRASGAAKGFLNSLTDRCWRRLGAPQSIL